MQTVNPTSCLFKDVTPACKLLVGDVFLETTLKNLTGSNGKIAVSVYDAQSLEGYQVKGTTQYVTAGAALRDAGYHPRSVSAH